jgi:hypothetical protein
MQQDEHAGHEEMGGMQQDEHAGHDTHQQQGEHAHGKTEE